MIHINGKILIRYILALLCIGAALFLLVSFFSYSSSDVTWFFNSSDAHSYSNYCGFLGANISGLLLYLLGSASLLCIFLCITGAALLKGTSMTKARFSALWVFMIFLSTLMSALGYEFFAVRPGGIIGSGFYTLLMKIFDKPLIPLFLAVSLWAASIVFLQFRWARFLVQGFTGVFSALWSIQLFARARKKTYVALKHGYNACFYWKKEKVDAQTLEELVDAVIHDEYGTASLYNDEQFDAIFAQAVSDVAHTQKVQEFALTEALEESSAPEAGLAQGAPDQAAAENLPPVKPFSLPPKLLFKNTKHQAVDKEYQKECRTRAAVLENKLECFGIMGSIISITIGPVVTLYEYQPDIDVKVSKIVALEDDLALALEAQSLRIMAPMPGKSVIGFEVAYGRRMTVYFSELITNKIYKDNDSALPLVLGQDTIGDPVIIDLAGLPHLLVAGATGSGKSVALHTMLVSLLCARTPDELRLVIIDPKRLEFSAYAHCAHLLFPIIVDPQKAVAACNYVLGVMEERYTRMAAAGVRTIADYNTFNPKDTMPFIVIIVDELADLMITSGKEIELVLARLAQMARAAGIHLIVATQRPSVDVITGLIKANFPARIAFKVASKIDSRTILDTQGAEKLLGKGDMLFLNGQGVVKRVHGAFLTEAEINSVVSHIKQQRAPSYIELAQTSTNQQIDPEDESLYQDIVTFLQGVDDISISLLQRQFRIGYNRSARIIQMLEAEGRIMTVEGGKTRRVVK